jgi:hypothetical protein
MDRSKLAAVLLLLVALVVGAVGAQGCNLYLRHNEQHHAAEADHQLLQQLIPIVNQLLAIEQQRQKR